MRISISKLTYDKLVSLIHRVERELEPILIILEDGSSVERKIIQLSYEELHQVQEDIVANSGWRDSTAIDRCSIGYLKNLPGLYGQVENILIVSDYLHRDIDDGIIDLKKIMIDRNRREESLKEFSGFNGQWRI